MESTLYFLDPIFWSNPWLVTLFGVTLFGIVEFRYLIAAGAYHWILLRRNKTYRQLSVFANKIQRNREIRWSIISSIIFAVLSALTFFFFQRSLTRIYTNIHDHSLVYFFFSIFLILVLYETYYYWLHRWMHRPGVFRYVHKVHHESIHTSVFTSFSFHPLEATLQFIFIPILTFVLPVHYYALGTVLMLMTLSAVINHAGVEIFSQRFLRHSFGRWFIGSTHHDLHHHEFKNNYGLYLTWWDKWMKTESKNYEKKIDTLNQSQ